MTRRQYLRAMVAVNRANDSRGNHGSLARKLLERTDLVVRAYIAFNFPTKSERNAHAI